MNATTQQMPNASAKRRVGAETSETRALIVDTAEQVIRDEGYAAASTRRVAMYAGLNPSLVHYYFPTTDDLLLAVFERGAAQSDSMIEGAIATGDPVRALWRFFCDDSRTALSVEYLALAIRRPAIREKVAAHSTAMRNRQVDLFQTVLGEQLASTTRCSPEALSVILAGIGRALFMESALGVTAGHEEAMQWVAAWLDKLLPPPPEPDN
ncbi:TetR/AcrR family transcriptional regulator [Blastomonas fulva]|uniref:TetR family transcriptional regulator n=1 Tax=Blastomonas fulva TaxID=1550728 RepID=A0ABM6M8E3_9SPHN|nr:TetR/AcrR family transcriptional regulator [Blastomonas fulva]ASR52251.1 TetR family transcriptional regulator [Blastomonas fulva]